MFSLSSLLQIMNVVTDICLPATKVDGDVPIPLVRHNKPRRKTPKESAAATMLKAGPTTIVAEIVVVGQVDVTLMRAVNNDDIARMKIFTGMNEITHGIALSIYFMVLLGWRETPNGRGLHSS